MVSEGTSPDEGSGMPRDTDDLVLIGHVSRPHGLKGEVRVFPATGCEELYPRIERFFVETTGGLVELVPRRVRSANRYIIIHFEGYQGRNEADRLRDKVLWVSPADLPELEEGDVYQFSQLGALVYDEEGRALGKVEEIMASPAHPIFRIVGPEGEILFPATDPWIVSLEMRDDTPVIIVRLPEGLIESQRGGKAEES
jgi:16S rRNA processing protein RimM